MNKQEKCLNKSIIEKDSKIDHLLESEELYKYQLSDLQANFHKLKDQISNYQLKEEQHESREEHHKSRVKELETEILSQVKIESEMEQEIRITCQTIETLRTSNESCNNQRARLQTDLLEAQKRIYQFEADCREYTIADLETKEELKELQDKYESCENQKNRLQKDIVVLQEKLLSMEIIETRFEQLKEDSKHSKLNLIRCQEELNETQNRLKYYQSSEQIFEELKEDSKQSKLELKRCREDLNETQNRSKLELKRCQEELNETQNRLKYYQSSEQIFEELKEDSKQSKLELIRCREELNETQNRLKYYQSSEQILFLNDAETFQVDLTCDVSNGRPNLEINHIANELVNNVLQESVREELCHHGMNKLHAEYKTPINTESKTRSIEQDSIKNRGKQDEIEVQKLKVDKNNLALAKTKIELLEGDIKLLEFKISQKDFHIEDVSERCQTLEDNITNKNYLINDLESCIEDLQIELNKLSKTRQEESRSADELQEYSITLSKELVEKNRQICEIEIDRQKIQQSLQKSNRESEELFKEVEVYKQEQIRQLKEKEVSSEIDTEVVELLKERIQELESNEKELLEREIELKNTICLSVNEPCTERLDVKENIVCTYKREGNTDKDANKEFQSSEEYLKENILILEENLEEKNSVIQVLENDIITLCAELSIRNQNFNSVDYSYDDGNVVSKEKYIDLEEKLQHNNTIILDLEEHITFLQQEIGEIYYRERGLNDSSSDEYPHDLMVNNNSDENLTNEQTSNVGLRLPQPDLLSNQSPSHQKLPLTPGTSIMPTPRPTASSADSEKKRYDLDRQHQRYLKEIEMTRGNGVKMESASELRRKLVKLNSELIQKKLEVGNVEEELKNSRRKQDRAEDGYR